MKSQTLSLFALCATAFALSGCYNDTKNLEKSVAEGKPVATTNTPVPTLKPGEKPADSNAQPTQPAPSKKDDKKPETKPLSPTDLGLPFYPGAKPRKNPDGSERMLPVTSSAMMLEQETPDTITQVDAFYQRNFAGATRNVTQEGGSASYQYLLTGADGKAKVVELKTEGKVTVITLGSVEITPASPSPSTAPAKPLTSPPPTTP